MSKKLYVLIALNVTDKFGGIQEKYIYKTLKGGDKKPKLNILAEDMFEPKALKDLLNTGAIEEYKKQTVTKTSSQPSVKEKATAQEAYFQTVGKAAPKSWTVAKINEELEAWTQAQFEAKIHKLKDIGGTPTDEMSLEDLDAAIQAASANGGGGSDESS